MDPNQNTPIYSTPQPIISPVQQSTASPSGVWPGAFGIYKKSAQAVKFNLGAVLGTLFLGLVASIIGDLDDKDSSVGLLIVTIIANIFAIIFSVALLHASLSSARFQKTSLGTVLKQAFSFQTVKYFAMCIVIGIIIVLSLLALVIPFFFVAPRLMMAPYYLLDKNLGPIESIKASWAASKEHVGKVWGLIGVTVLCAIGFIILIGLYFYAMYIAAYALLYLFISGQSWHNEQGATDDATPPSQAVAPVTGQTTSAQTFPNTVAPQTQVPVTPPVAPDQQSQNVVSPQPQVTENQPDQTPGPINGDQNKGPVVS